MSYQFTVEQRPNYVHTKVTGKRTPENTQRYLRDSCAACVDGKHSALLLEMHFSGPSLTTASVFELVASRVYDGKKLRKIAYVEGSVDDAAMPAFAVDVAVNRGVNVRLFGDVGAAAIWLAAPEA
jgi:hypothetical protein